MPFSASIRGPVHRKGLRLFLTGMHEGNVVASVLVELHHAELSGKKAGGGVDPSDMQSWVCLSPVQGLSLSLSHGSRKVLEVDGASQISRAARNLYRGESHSWGGEVDEWLA